MQRIILLVAHLRQLQDLLAKFVLPPQQEDSQWRCGDG